MSTATEEHNPRTVMLMTVALVAIVLLMVMPLPPMMMDLLLSLSIAVALTLLVIAIQLRDPLELSAFPSILLFATLFRLALNVASTRLILLRGGEGASAAGNIIRAFGEFVVGGNYLVGAAVFILLIIINFTVITKGSGRVAEVAARFTLDAMPGKQMAIDSDLAAGNMTADEATRQRSELQQSADFFGAMDGASKFVRGDAVAGLLMTGVNIIVGFAIGVLQEDMTMADSAQTYTILTVGDGLVSQIPSLIISVAAGVVVTQAGADGELAPALIEQVGERKQPLLITGGLLAAIGVMPGMPALPFMLLAGAVFYLARKAPNAQSLAARKAAKAEQTSNDPVSTSGDGTESGEGGTEREKLEDMLPVDLLELEVGFDLVPLVDSSKGGELVERITNIRRNLAQEMGVIIPSVHIRDNLKLKPGQYRLLLSGNTLGEGELRINKMLAMDPTGVADDIDGEQVREPAFGLPARWVEPEQRDEAETAGYTVVDNATVVTTHLTELVRQAAPDLLGRTEAQELIDILAKREPRLVDELIPNLLPLGDVIQVMRGLLLEGISIRDLRTVLDALADNARTVKEVPTLIELVRQRMARHISARFQDEANRVAALALDPSSEELFRSGEADAGAAQRMLASLESESRNFAGVTTPPALLCAADVRRSVAEFFTPRVPGLSVISYQEVDPRCTVRKLGVVSS